jgi:type IV pilus assembly protein PilM
MASASSAWGIDVGNRALKAVRLVRGPEGPVIDDFEIVEHEHVLSQSGDNRDSYIQQSLANFVQRHGAKGGAVAIGVSGQSSFARFIKLPPVETKKIPEIVRFEAIQQIPFPLDDVEWSYQLFQEPESPDVEVGIFAMRKELVNRHLQFFTESGLDIDIVQMNPLAVYNAMYHDGRIKGTTMIVDLGAENTDLIIAEGETIWLRSIPIGGNNFTEALIKSFKLKFAKAEELKRNAATSKYGRQILQAMRPVFADLVAEIQRSIGFYASVHRDSRIARVIALGGTFRLPGLQKYLQQNLQLEVARLDRLGSGAPTDARLASAFNDNLLSSVSAYGLALQAMGDGKINSSLLPEKIRRERLWKAKTKWFAAAAATFVLASGVAYTSWYFDHVQFQRDHAAHGDEIQKALVGATDMDRKWKEIESSGGPDRQQIGMVNGLLWGRDVWPGLIQDVTSSFPAPPSDPAKLTAMAQSVKRSQRPIILLQDWSTHYESDMKSILEMSDAGFSALAGTSATPAAVRSRPIGGIPFPTGGMPIPGRGPTGPMGMYPPTMTSPRPTAPTPSAGASGSTPATDDLRGFLLTLRCTTPNAGRSTFVTSTLVKALRDLGAANPDESRSYQIKRVVVVSDKAVSEGPKPGGGQGRQRGFAPGNFFRPPGLPLPGQAPPTGKPAEIDPFEDPLFPGESMKDDAEVTLLVAVVLAPKKETPKTQQQQVARAGN